MELTAQEITVQGNAIASFLSQKLSEALSEIARLNGAVAILEYRLSEAAKPPAVAEGTPECP